MSKCDYLNRKSYERIKYSIFKTWSERQAIYYLRNNYYPTLKFNNKEYYRNQSETRLQNKDVNCDKEITFIPTRSDELKATIFLSNSPKYSSDIINKIWRDFWKYVEWVSRLYSRHAWQNSKEKEKRKKSLTEYRSKSWKGRIIGFKI